MSDPTPETIRDPNATRSTANEPPRWRFNPVTRDAEPIPFQGIPGFEPGLDYCSGCGRKAHEVPGEWKVRPATADRPAKAFCPVCLAKAVAALRRS